MESSDTPLAVADFPAQATYLLTPFMVWRQFLLIFFLSEFPSRRSRKG
jgi:hypothetical protein